MKRVPTLPLFTLVVVLIGCAKEPTADPLPLEGFVVYDAVPVRTVENPYSGGIAVLCKRSIDDPVLANALFFQANGALQGGLDFASLPSTVESITFGTEAWSITDMVPVPDGTYLLIGVGIQTAIDDRIHVLVHHVDRAGAAVEPPVRRFVADKGTLLRANDLNELYRTRALGVLRDPDHLIVTVRYDRAEGPTVVAYHRTFQVALVAGVGSNGGPSIPLATADHLLHSLVADGAGGTYLFMDTTNASGPGTDLLVTHSTWNGETLTDVEQVVLGLRDAVPTSVRMQNGDLVLAGHYQEAADVRRPFFSRAGELAGLQNGIVLPQLAGSDRTALIGALIPTSSGFLAVCSVYDQEVLSVRALRDDRFCDLVTAQLAGDGTVLSTTQVIPAKGMRALGAWGGQGEWAIGAFHPYLNTEYMHAFVLNTP